jgi:hypothetical protein
MRLNGHQERALRLVAKRPMILRDLTHSQSLDVVQVSNPIQTLYLNQMVEEGYILEISDKFYIAPKGRDYLQQLEVEKQVHARQKPGLYTGPKWNLREGSQDFLRFTSKGLG